MMIKQGFNTDFGKDKFDIGLDETDLRRILAGAGISPDAELRLEEAEEILRLAAQYFCLRQQAMVDPKYSGDVRADTARLNKHLNDRLDRVKARLAVVQSAAV